MKFGKLSIFLCTITFLLGYAVASSALNITFDEFEKMKLEYDEGEEYKLEFEVKKVYPINQENSDDPVIYLNKFELKVSKDGDERNVRLHEQKLLRFHLH